MSNNVYSCNQCGSAIYCNNIFGNFYSDDGIKLKSKYYCYDTCYNIENLYSYYNFHYYVLFFFLLFSLIL